MIFSELYSAYYNTVAAILCSILQGEQSEKELQRIVTEHAFVESVLTILPALKGEKWQLVHSDLTTPLRHIPTMPLTTLQKRWLKAISQDVRVKLFDVPFPDLDDVAPLFTPADYCIYDKYGDGDPYEDAEYVRQFRVILEAIRQGTQVKFRMTNRRGQSVFIRCRPLRLEYSEKDDKFRVITAGCRYASTVNLARICGCVPDTGEIVLGGSERPVKSETLTVQLRDERNTLERFMLHFAHFEKQAERLDRLQYLVKIKYAQDDEPEMVIRILSFGPTVQVLGSERFKALIVQKLKSQLRCHLK